MAIALQLIILFIEPGIFHEHIKFLLCITTPINIYLLGVNFTQQSSTLQGNLYGTIGLHPEPLFVVATDNVYMTAICGTTNGRIFLAGKDSSLYELVYQVSRYMSRNFYQITLLGLIFAGINFREDKFSRGFNFASE